MKKQLISELEHRLVGGFSVIPTTFIVHYVGRVDKPEFEIHCRVEDEGRKLIVILERMEFTGKKDENNYNRALKEIETACLLNNIDIEYRKVDVQEPFFGSHY